MSLFFQKVSFVHCPIFLIIVNSFFDAYYCTEVFSEKLKNDPNLTVNFFKQKAILDIFYSLDRLRRELVKNVAHDGYLLLRFCQ